jgi:hypothetical protein
MELKDRRSSTSKRRLKQMVTAIDIDKDDQFGKNDEDWNVYLEIVN